jgi:hypothetical protein
MSFRDTKLKWLNSVNGGDTITYNYCERLLLMPDDIKLYGAILGSAYGGELEAVGKLWKDRGVIYGFDTFEGHPKHLMPDGEYEFEINCMDAWYSSEEYGTDNLSEEYQRGVLDELGLDNVILKKGLVHEKSLEEIPHLHFAFLDMDIYESMKIGYQAVRDLVLPGHALFIHDAIPSGHIPRVHSLVFDEILNDNNMWELVETWEPSFMVCLKRRVE